MQKAYLVVFVSLIMTACSGVESKDEQNYAYSCPEIRSKMCTFDYKPVCGISNDGSEKVYSNACVACANESVVGYNNTECQENKQ